MGSALTTLYGLQVSIGPLVVPLTAVAVRSLRFLLLPAVRRQVEPREGATEPFCIITLEAVNVDVKQADCSTSDPLYSTWNPYPGAYSPGPASDDEEAPPTAAGCTRTPPEGPGKGLAALQRPPTPPPAALFW